jgi:hypothetical protein
MLKNMSLTEIQVPDAQTSLIYELKSQLEKDSFWGSYWKEWNESHSSSLHLAIFTEPFLGYVLEGRKTIESRFSVNRQAPYQRAAKGDVILLKRSGGPVIGICQVAQVWFYHLDADSWCTIKQYSQALCAQDPEFWIQRENASYATLMKIRHVRRIEPFIYPKRDRRGWVVLHEGAAQLFDA